MRCVEKVSGHVDGRDQASAVPCLMAFAASSDLLTMTISNRLSLALAGGFFLLALVTGMTLYAFGMHLAAATVVLVVLP